MTVALQILMEKVRDFVPKSLGIAGLPDQSLQPSPGELPWTRGWPLPLQGREPQPSPGELPWTRGRPLPLQATKAPERALATKVRGPDRWLNITLARLGLWSGIIICCFLQAVCFLGFILRLNWAKASEEARVRAKLKGPVTKALKHQDRVIYQGPIPSVDLEHQAGVLLGDAGDVVNKEESQTEKPVEPEEPLSGPPPKNKDLSLKVLLLRRGLTLLAAVLILVVGILVRVYTGT